LASFFLGLARALRPVGNVEKLTAGQLTGWAAGPTTVVVEAWLEGRCVIKAKPGIARRDVAAAYPSLRSAANSGFSLHLPADCVDTAAPLSRIRVVAKPSIPFLPSATLGTFHLAAPGLAQSLAKAPKSGIRSPFPREVTDAIAAHWPEDCFALDTAAGQQRFVRRLTALLAAPEVNSLPFIADYSLYLSRTYAHCKFVEKHFPAMNKRAAPDAPDFHCKPNSVRELFPIIHQLYVLRSYGVEGEFLEAGCFKGYSSSMLSFACQQLGVTMHILDSFEGLPACSGSGYEAGQYAGDLAEVQENVARFGAIGCVQFRKGFFANTLRDWRAPELMCLWMDVDLESSAIDLMALADRLHPRATVFSHECVAQSFNEGIIDSIPSADNPVAPVLERFNNLGRPLTGQHVAGFTGALWPIENGIPVIDTDVLFELLNAVLT